MGSRLGRTKRPQSQLAQGAATAQQRSYRAPDKADNRLDKADILPDKADNRLDKSCTSKQEDEDIGLQTTTNVNLQESLGPEHKNLQENRELFLGLGEVRSDGLSMRSELRPGDVSQGDVEDMIRSHGELRGDGRLEVRLPAGGATLTYTDQALARASTSTISET